MAGSFYFMNQSQAAKAARDVEKIQAEAASKMKDATSDFEKKQIQADAAEKTRAAQRKAEFTGKEAALQARAKGKEAQLKALEAKVNSELAAAAKTVKAANALKAKAAFERNAAAKRLREAQAAKAKADASGKAIDQKLAAEKAKLARAANAKVAAANAKASAAARKAKAEAKKAINLKNALNKVNAKLGVVSAKLAGVNFERAAPYGAVPGYQIGGRKGLGNKVNVSDPNVCKALARAKGANVWGHRNASHPSAKWRNSCFFYKTNPRTRYAGNKADKIHMIGCSVGGNPKTGCTAVPPKAKAKAKASSMSTAEARCYLLRYADLRKAFSSNTNKAKNHWKDWGFKEKRNKSCGDMKVAIGYGSRWCADEGNRMLCNRGAIGGWEKQTLKHVKDGNVFAIKGGRNQKYCADETNKIRCNRGGIGGWEKFKIYPRKTGIVMRGGKKKRWCKLVGGAIRCNTYKGSKKTEFKMKNL
tara:strand:- start:102 stop:1526 length:1425 start_codon:yes stop_codon:yes gene_type:complete